MPDILFPPGRMIGGNVDKLFPRTESNGQPKIGRDGQPEMQCSIGYAIPKAGETHWNQTPWGKTIYETGAAAHPNLVASPAFSWKITDGDSTLPNKKGKRPCDQNGYPGHWVLWLSQGWLPKRVNADGSIELPEGAIVPGFYIQIFGSVAGNKLVPNGTPGVYLNPIAVALIGEGDRIQTDVDTTAVGFGAAPMPAGARPVTPAAPQFAPPTAPAAPTLPPAQGNMPVHNPVPPVMNAQGAYVGAPPVMPPGVQPAPDFLNPPVAPAPPVRQMTALAQGQTYETFRNAGWTDQQLIANGYMLP